MFEYKSRSSDNKSKKYLLLSDLGMQRLTNNYFCFLFSISNGKAWILCGTYNKITFLPKLRILQESITAQYFF